MWYLFVFCRLLTPLYFNLMTVEQLNGIKELLNLAEIERRTGMKPGTLWRKCQRGTELTVRESDAIEEVLRRICAALREAPHPGQ